MSRESARPATRQSRPADPVNCPPGLFRAVFRAVLVTMAWLALCMIACAVFLGCTTYKGGRIVEGTDITAGMSLPQSGGTLQIDALNFLTGFRFLFCDNAGVKCTYATTNSVSAFGVYQSTTVKRIDIELTPTIDEAEDDPETKEDAEELDAVIQ